MWFKDSTKDRGEAEDSGKSGCVCLSLALQWELWPAGGRNVLQGFQPTGLHSVWKNIDSWYPLKRREADLSLNMIPKLEKHS